MGRLNIDSRGRYLGEFDTGDNIIVVYKDGNYELTNFELSNRFEMRDVMMVEKFNENDVISAAYWDNAQKNMYVKRFYIEAIVPDKKYLFISESPGSKLYYATNHPFPVLELVLVKGRKGEEVTELIEVADFIDIKGWKSQGNRLSQYEIKKVTGKKGETTDDESSSQPETQKSNVKIGTQMEWDLEEKKGKDKGEQTKLF